MALSSATGLLLYNSTYYPHLMLPSPFLSHILHSTQQNAGYLADAQIYVLASVKTVRQYKQQIGLVTQLVSQPNRNAYLHQPSGAWQTHTEWLTCSSNDYMTCQRSSEDQKRCFEDALKCTFEHHYGTWKDKLQQSVQATERRNGMTYFQHLKPKSIKKHQETNCSLLLYCRSRIIFTKWWHI